MRRILLSVLLGFLMMSCSTEENGPNIEYGIAPITSSEFPEYFEPGKNYDIRLTYKLPTTCHSFIGFDGGREDPNTQEFFIYALTSRNLDLTNCATEDPELTKFGTIRNFLISENVSEDEVFIFRLWKGTDDENNPIFETIEIPVGETDLQTAG